MRFCPDSGSSSQKTALFDLRSESSSEPVAPLWEGKLDWDGSKETLTIKNSAGKKIRSKKETGDADHTASVEKLLQHLWSGETAVLGDAVSSPGDRPSHCSRRPKLTQPTIITPGVRQAISDVSSIAPLHNQAGLQGIDLASKLVPQRSPGCRRSTPDFIEPCHWRPKFTQVRIPGTKMAFAATGFMALITNTARSGLPRC